MLSRWFSRRSTQSNEVPAPSQSGFAAVEQLESRRMMADAARVSGVIADNYGGFEVTFDAPLNRRTANVNSVTLFAVGKDRKFNTADDVKITGTVAVINRDRTVQFSTTALTKGTRYRVRFDSTQVLGRDGQRIDGEFRANARSGNRRPGGDYLFYTDGAQTRTAGVDFLTRLQTPLGTINQSMYASTTPLTVANYMQYVDQNLYNGVVFHRVVSNFVIQGGGFTSLTTDNDGYPAAITNLGTVQNEFNAVPGNIRGTIAMAKLGGNPNSASNQFFYNLADNRGTSPNGLNFQNGGFTTFAKVADANSLAVMDIIGALPAADLSNGATTGTAAVFNEVPNNNNAFLIIQHVGVLNNVYGF